MFGTLRVKLRRLAEQINELQTTIKNPIVEFSVSVQPKFIASYNKHVFFCDEQANLVSAELNEGLSVKSVAKINISNVRGLAANKKYLALSFSELSTDQISLSSKSFKKLETKSGVLIFQFSENFAVLQFDKVIANGKNYNLISPCGIGLLDKYLFVCDRELHAVFKIDLKSGNMSHKLVNSDQEPVRISVGEKYFAYTDALKLEVHLLDVDKFHVVKTVRFSDELFADPFDVSLKENGYVFVKNQSDNKVILYDGNLNIKYSFDYEHSFKLGLHFLKHKKDFLLIGSINENRHRDDNAYKLGLFSEF